VSCVITCYSEGHSVRHTLLSLIHQEYPGCIEIIAVIDDAQKNEETLRTVCTVQAALHPSPLRSLVVLPKRVRGGRASSLNAGLAVAKGEVLLALDGDTSFDNDMVRRAMKRMCEPGVVAVAGTLRVRNSGKNLLTRLQALDYLVYRQFVRAGLSSFNVINNIPGAHGVFSASLLRRAGGWDTGSAEDVDLTLRIKMYFGRNRAMRIVADPHVISHTDVPHRWVDFLRQRLRWEGDPVYLYLRKHGPGLRPRVMGWRNFIFSLWYGVVFQILLPPTLLCSLLALLLVAEPSAAASILQLAYLMFLAAAAAVYLLQLCLISERRRTDLELLWLLPMYPLFMLLIRVWSALAVLHSLLLRSHLDTSMAPWWVLRKGKF
jgi:cellulose synthase/poly-beta-1,6-N-acetylglucosamine synthase-like glycosyltransferase